MTNARSLTATLTTALIITANNPLASAADTEAYNQCPQVESLKCRNGSTCVEGFANFGKQHEDLNLITHEEGWHCQCLDGYIGHECAIEVSECVGNHYEMQGNKLHSCYHGAACGTKFNGAGDLAGVYCDCNSINTESAPTASKFAGLMCEHEATSLCVVSLTEYSAPKKQFCTNHGKCVKMVTEGEAHPGCVCREGWTGDHCELEQDMLQIDPLTEANSEGGGNKTAAKVLFSLLVAAIVCVVLGIGIVVYRIRRDKKGPSTKAVGKTAGEVGVGDLDPDGSATMVKDMPAEGQDRDGDGLELKTRNEDFVIEDDAPASTTTDDATKAEII